MTKKTPSKKSTKKTVEKVVTNTLADTAEVLAARNKYRSSAKFPKARTAGK